MELQNVCRICDSRENLHVIGGYGDTISTMLGAIGISMIGEADHVPRYICLDCIHKLKEWYDFKSLYEATYSKFKKESPDSKWSNVSIDDPGIIKREIKNETPSESDSVQTVSFSSDGDFLTKEGTNHTNQTETQDELKDITIKNKGIETWKNQVLHSCQQCGKKYYREVDIEYQDKCKECGISFKDRRNLITYEQPNLNSDECGKSSQILKQKYTCDECGKSFDQPHRFNVHKALHLNPDLYKCVKCDKSFKRSYDLKRHKKLHRNPELYKCEICGKCLSRQSLLDEHKITHHFKSNPHVCDECGKSFKLKRYLVIHKRVHLTRTLHKCDECGKTFRKLNTYIDHKAWHINPDANKCKECGKTFTRLEYLKLHINSHLKPDLHQCNICEKSFTRQYNLKNHKLLHIRPQDEWYINLI